MRFVCFRCGHRQENDTACGSCSNDIVHDLGERSTWRHLRDIESRLGRQRHARIIGIASLAAVPVAIGLYLATLMYYGPRGGSPPRTVLQVLIAVTLGVALGLVAVLEKTWGQKRMFPFLDQEDDIRAGLATPPGKHGGKTSDE
jgi:hypothetical protein